MSDKRCGSCGWAWDSIENPRIISCHCKLSTWRKREMSKEAHACELWKERL